MCEFLTSHPILKSRLNEVEKSQNPHGILIELSKQQFKEKNPILGVYDLAFLGNFNDGIILYPGSFNPLHDGHIYVMNTAQRKRKRQVIFEISINRRGKQKYSIEDIGNIINDFYSKYSLNRKSEAPLYILISNTELIIEKFKLVNQYHTIEFLLGIDSYYRLKYDMQFINENELTSHNGYNRLRLIVADRYNKHMGKFETINKHNLFPFHSFHVSRLELNNQKISSLSSTDIRSKQQQDSK